MAKTIIVEGKNIVNIVNYLSDNKTYEITIKDVTLGQSEDDEDIEEIIKQIEESQK